MGGAAPGLIDSGLQADCNLATAGANHGFGVLTQIVETNPVELAGALARDAQPTETVPRRAHSDGVVSRKRARGRMASFREGWKHWASLNATDLIWTALVIGGVLFTSWLMKG
jgi:hypothetical protein